MVKINGVITVNDRAGRRAHRCRGLELVDDAGNQLGYVDFSNTGELNLWLDPRISVTMEAGGVDFTRHMPDSKVGHYYCPVNPTVENNLDVISRHLVGLKERGIQVGPTKVEEASLPRPVVRGTLPRLYPFTTRSR